MIWKLRHRLFGTHFVLLEYGFGSHPLAVQFTLEPRPRAYVKIAGDTIFLDDRSEKWEALTFDRSEFLNRMTRPTLRAVQ
jgi:hypothetical protein